MAPVPDLLEQELYRLAAGLENREIPLIIGGGYGLLLWQRHVRASGHPTLRPVPYARSTEDLDVFFPVRIMCESENTRAIREVLDELGYEVIEGRKNYQFARTASQQGEERTVKVDLLTPTPRSEEAQEQLRVRERRVRPRGFSGLHAHPTPEAITLEDHQLQVDLDPGDSDGGPVSVYVPHLFTFAVLKLFAYRDRRDDPYVDRGQHHAYDLYRSLAMMSEEDWDTAHRLHRAYNEADVVQEAGRIAAAYFGAPDDQGTLALRTYVETVGAGLSSEYVEGFIQDLGDLFAD